MRSFRHPALPIFICLAALYMSGCQHLFAKKVQDTDPIIATAADQEPMPAANAPADLLEPTSPPWRQGAGEANDASTGIRVDAKETTTSAPTESTVADEHAGSGPDTASSTNDMHTVQEQLDEALEFCDAAQAFWQKGELESALEALDKAYSLILSVESHDPAKLIQQKEDLRYLISKRILEIYASRNIVVNGNHNAIPRELNATIEREIKLFAGPEKRFFIASYQRSGHYRPMILKKLKAAGLPPELSWLPLIESGFKVKALSRARALGLWQFIPSTGYKFGLKRDQYIDERIDFEKSTDAAIAYLKELHKIFGDWSTVLAAYNCGEGRVLHVIRTQNINYLDDFWDLYGRLPFETARYVPRFLAALHIIENPARYGLDKVDPHPPLEFERVEIQRQVHLKDLAPAIDTPLDTLKALNPELRYRVLPPAGYSLRVPPGKKTRLLAAIDQVPVSTPPQRTFVYHRIRRGETLSTIARRYGTSVKKIMWANNLKRSSYIVAGKKLKIPQRGMVVAQAPATPPSTTEWKGQHVVRSGDSLWIIAKKYNTTTKQIQKMNGLPTTRLRIDQVLRVPSPTSAAVSQPAVSGNYYVQRGDSPYLIARKHNMALDRFLEINGLTPRSTIYPGQSVKIE